LIELSIEEATERNNCFREATRSYIGRNGKSAKELSLMGHQHGQKMAAAQKKAAELLKEIHKTNGRKQFIVVDLHGFHVDRALEILENILDFYLKSFRQQLIQVVTGAGFHSSGTARLKPAVKEYLIKRKLSFSSYGVGAFLININQ